MISSNALSLVSSFRARNSGHKGCAKENWTSIANLVFAMLCFALALVYHHQGELSSNHESHSSFFFGATPVTAAVATTALSSRVPRASRPTMVSMTAGSSRTLIEWSSPENQENGEMQIEVMYLDEADEDGLLVLRRANIDSGPSKNTQSVAKGGRAVYKRAVRLLRNPIVVMVMVGNIASMIGVLPPGIAGFLPAVAIFLQKKTKWAAPVLRRLRSTVPFKAVVSKLRIKLGKVISNLYENRSRYSLLSDFLWYVDNGEDKNKQKNSNSERTSTYKAIA